MQVQIFIFIHNLVFYGSLMFVHFWNFKLQTLKHL
jgi:hypothetical protein